jgi:hypothetical protein
VTKQQNEIASKAYENFISLCSEHGTDRNRHDGVAAFMIAKALMKSTLGLKYYQAEKLALNYLAGLP